MVPSRIKSMTLQFLEKIFPSKIPTSNYQICVIRRAFWGAGRVNRKTGCESMC
jgi:hypothetical protein